MKFKKMTDRTRRELICVSIILIIVTLIPMIGYPVLASLNESIGETLTLYEFYQYRRTYSVSELLAHSLSSIDDITEVYVSRTTYDYQAYSNTRAIDTRTCVVGWRTEYAASLGDMSFYTVTKIENFREGDIGYLSMAIIDNELIHDYCIGEFYIPSAYVTMDYVKKNVMVHLSGAFHIVEFTKMFKAYTGSDLPFVPAADESGYLNCYLMLADGIMYASYCKGSVSTYSFIPYEKALRSIDVRVHAAYNDLLPYAWKSDGRPTKG